MMNRASRSVVVGAATVALALTPHVVGKQLTFVEHPVSDTARPVVSVAIADMNRDGFIDILASASNDIFWYESDGSSPPMFTERLIRSTRSAAFIVAVDLDSDGDLDVVASNSGVTWWYESSGGANPSFTEYLIEVDGAGGASHCTVADIDRDGDMDIVTGGALILNTLTVAWYENDGGVGGMPPNFTQHEIENRTPNNSQLSAVFVEDFDRDGDPDVLYSNPAGTVTWLENDDATFGGIWPRSDLPAETTNWHNVHAADLDCDGDPDVVAGNPALVFFPGIYWFESDGESPPTFIQHTLVSGDQLEEIACADLDSDGDMDVLGAQLQQDEMSWYENLGGSPPTFFKRVVFNEAGSGPRHVLAADLDCDGDLDIVMGTTNDGRVRWFENVACPGDFDGDGEVGILDFLKVLGNWGPCR